MRSKAANYPKVFDYTPDRSRDGPRRFLEVEDDAGRRRRWRGYLQCDAYKGYEGLFAAERQRRRQIYEVGCWAHARRYFYDARASSGQDAIEALALIGRLYHVKHEAREAKVEGRALLAHRREHAEPVLKSFKVWMLARLGARTGVLPQSELGKAIHYTYDNFRALSRYIMRGYLNIDNNAAERALRNVVIGRKNWLFAGSDEGGKSAAVIYSLVESAKHCGCNPYEYLRDVLTRLPETRMSAVGELLPDARLKARRASTAS
ncbi:MAG: IS66 family transposase [Planctomycetes bacterium]|nr:IS66 family transposase [Planctomycetota bacterium]